MDPAIIAAIISGLFLLLIALIKIRADQKRKERNESGSEVVEPKKVEITIKQPETPQIEKPAPPKVKVPSDHIFNLPHPRNPNFTGRESLLQKLRDSLCSGEDAALTQAISGLGGVGKTQLALEYAYRHRDDYDVIWWIQSEETAKMAADYAELALRLDLAEAETTDQPTLVKLTRSWLEENENWLLIFDNVVEPGDLRDYRPHGGRGHLIVTSRYPDWRGTASPLPVKVFDRDESIKFLLRRTGQDDEEAARQLAKALGDLPLALAQAAGYMEASGRALTDYLELFEEHHQELLKLGEPPQDYSWTVAATWELAFEEIKKTPGAAELLNLCAFLAPDDIPIDVIKGGAEHLPGVLAGTVSDELKWDEATRALRRYSLIDVSGETLSLHRLVQAVARDRSGDKAGKDYAAAAVELVNSAFPDESSDVRTWPQCQRLMAHAISAAEHAEEYEVANEATARLWNQCGTYSWAKADYKVAKEHLERALRIDEKAFGPDHPKVAIHLSNIGSVLRAQRELQVAKAHFERALRIDEKVYGPYHTKVAIRLNNLGGVFKDLGDLQGAKEYYERALQILKKSQGEDHPNVASAYNNLGSVLQDLGDLQGAKEHYERALKIDEKVFGLDHPNLARDVNNLGGVLRALGDLQRANEHYERALQILKKLLGEDHPDVASTYNNLGSVLHDLGDLQGAKLYCKQALKIFIQFLGEDHPKTQLVRDNLASLGK